MTKNKKILMVIFLALVICVGAGTVVYKAFAFKKVNIYVFNGTYEAGTKLTKDMFSTIQVDKTVVTNGVKDSIRNVFISDEKTMGNLIGDTLRVTTYEGMPITRAMLSTAGGTNIEMQLAEGKIAITVGINNITGVTNDLRANSSVDVVIINDGGTETIENMKILNVYKSDGVNISSVTFECSSDNYVKIAEAANNAIIHLGLIKGFGQE